jgi:hypothetical protein
MWKRKWKLEQSSRGAILAVSRSQELLLCVLAQVATRGAYYQCHSGKRYRSVRMKGHVAWVRSKLLTSIDETTALSVASSTVRGFPL